MTKLETVKHILNASAEIRDWYAQEHGVTAADMTESSVRTFGTEGDGEIAGMIIEDGLRDGLITRDQYEEAA